MSVVSSANSDVPGAAAGRSLTYKIKRRGPRMNPGELRIVLLCRPRTSHVP